MSLDGWPCICWAHRSLAFSSSSFCSVETQSVISLVFLKSSICQTASLSISSYQQFWKSIFWKTATCHWRLVIMSLKQTNKKPNSCAAETESKFGTFNKWQCWTYLGASFSLSTWASAAACLRAAIWGDHSLAHEEPACAHASLCYMCMCNLVCMCVWEEGTRGSALRVMQNFFLSSVSLDYVCYFVMVNFQGKKKNLRNCGPLIVFLTLLGGHFIENLIDETQINGRFAFLLF